MKKIGIVATIMALVLLLVTSVYAADPEIISTPITTATEDQAYSYGVEATDEDTEDTLTFSLTTHPEGMAIDSETGEIAWTPDQEDVDLSPHDVTVEVTDGENPVTQVFQITVTEVNDAPVIDVSDCTETDMIIEDKEYTCTVTALDEEDGVLTFSLVTAPEGMTIDSETGIIIWTPDDEQIGNDNIVVAVVDDGTPAESDTDSFTVFVRPDDVCGDFESGSDVEITDWDITDDDEDFYPGSKIEIEVDVENDGDEDLEDITVEVILYDTTDGKRIDVVKTDEFDLDEDEDETVELILEIPEDIDTDNDFIVFFSAYEDGNDDENCNWDKETGLTIKRRKHDVNIEKVVVSPSTVKAGKSVDVKVDVENVGDRDEEDVYVKVKNGELSIDKKSEFFDVDSYEKGDDDEYSVTITFTVPEDAEEADYDLEIYVYDDDDEIYESGTKFVTLFVEGTTTSSSSSSSTPTGAVTISTEGTPENVEQGESFSIPVKLTNTADEAKEYKITIANIGDWATSTSEFDAYLTAGQSSTYYITIMPNEDAAEGKHSATINIKEGTAVISTKTLSLTIPETETSGITGGAVVDAETEDEGGVFHNLFSGTTLWIIGDLLLIVVAIFFIKMLFSKKS